MRRNPFNMFLVAIAVCDATLMATYVIFKHVRSSNFQITKIDKLSGKRMPPMVFFLRLARLHKILRHDIGLCTFTKFMADRQHGRDEVSILILGSGWVWLAFKNLGTWCCSGANPLTVASHRVTPFLPLLLPSLVQSSLPYSARCSICCDIRLVIDILEFTTRRGYAPGFNLKPCRWMEENHFHYPNHLLTLVNRVDTVVNGTELQQFQSLSRREINITVS